MKTLIRLHRILTGFLLLALYLGFPQLAQAQFVNNGMGVRDNGSMRPNIQTTPREEEPKTAEEIIEEFMPSLTETLELNEFEKAVLQTTLLKYLKKRMEIGILELPPDQAREAHEKINKEEAEELKNGLSEEKYQEFMELRKEGADWKRKAEKEQKKKKREEKKKKKKGKSEQEEPEQ